MTDIHADIIDTLADAGFIPCDGSMSSKTVDYFAAKGWDAWRADLDGGLTFARWSEDDGIKLMSTTSSGVITAEARFDLNVRGLAWFAGAVKAEFTR